RRTAHLPQFREHRPPIPPRQHHVEDDQVIMRRSRQMQPVFAVLRHVQHKAALLQSLLQIGGGLWFILHDQEFHAGYIVQKAFVPAQFLRVWRESGINWHLCLNMRPSWISSPRPPATCCASMFPMRIRVWLSMAMATRRRGRNWRRWARTTYSLIGR